MLLLQASRTGRQQLYSSWHADRHSMLIGAGATVIWNDRVCTYLYYDGEILRINYQSNNVTGGVRISF
jgi:hypothetical protein